MAVLRLGTNLAKRGPATAWEIYRLHTRRAWLEHRVSDRFFSRQELEQCCATLFPGCRLEQLGGALVGLTWDSTLITRSPQRAPSAAGEPEADPGCKAHNDPAIPAGN